MEISCQPSSAKILRHWSVVCASVATMIIFWAVTPLLSAVLSINSISSFAEVTTSTSFGLLSESNQALTLNTRFMMTAYGSLWLGQSLPDFVTDEAAMLPFSMHSAEVEQLNKYTWTSTTTAYGTNLTCKPAKVIGNGSQAAYSNDNGCMTEAGALTFDYSQNFTALYIGYYMGPSTEFYLSGLGCSDPKFAHTFLAFWAALNNGEPHITASFCEPTYWKQQANVTVFGSNQTVLDILPLGKPQALTDSEFNITNFEYILSNGDPFQSQRADMPDIAGTLDQTYRMQKMGISPNATVTNMVGYALGTTQHDLLWYMDGENLGLAFEKAHKLLFALAARALLSNKSSDPEPRPGWIQGTINAVVVNRILALSAEASLGFVIALALALICLNWRRSINLRNDPASLSDVLAMIDHSENIKRGKSMRLEQGKLCLLESQEAGKTPSSESKADLRGDLDKHHVMLPIVMRLYTAAILLLVLVMALIAMVTLKIRISRYHGLPVPTTNAVAFQILTNYFPVIFATFLEPFWTLLNRVLCLLKPFEALRSGEARPSGSLYLRYTSLPPPLVIWRAFKARHFVLVAVCAIALSTNVLTVALSALFQTNPIIIESAGTFHYQYSPTFNASSTDILSSNPSAEPFYVATSNISDEISLPPWTSTNMFFLPFNTNASDPNVTFRAITTGFGAGLDCNEGPQNSTSYITSRIGTREPPWNFTLESGKSCIDGLTRPSGGQNRSSSALEVFRGLSSSGTDSSVDDVFCDTAFMAAFFRGNITVASDSTLSTYASTDDSRPDILAVNSVSATWMVCQSSFLTAPYEVTVDSTGRIQEAVRKGDYASELDPFFASPLNVTFFMSNVRNLWEVEDGDWWHNDTFADSWFAYFVKELSNSTELVDPKLPAPEFDTVAPFVQDAYSRIFAIMLSLNTDWLLPAHGETIVGSVLTVEDRLYMASAAYIISVTLLILNVMFALLYYAKRPAKMLRWMPTTISSITELFEGSGLISEVSGGSRLSEDMRIGYGRYIGTDGKPHMGIERRPFVIPWGNG